MSVHHACLPAPDLLLLFCHFAGLLPTDQPVRWPVLFQALPHAGARKDARLPSHTELCSSHPPLCTSHPPLSSPPARLLAPPTRLALSLDPPS
eukprot:2748409-Pleurochrysis_carterae.AAC.2